MKHYLRSIDPEQNRFRWYAMHMQLCFDGGVDLIRCWGRLGEGEGREKVEHFETEKEALEGARRVLAMRHHHGYEEQALESEESQQPAPAVQLALPWPTVS